MDAGQSMEVPAVRTFLGVVDQVFHTYTTYACGTVLLLGIINYLDLTALGRQEDWEKPSGRSDGRGGTWICRHDEYDYSVGFNFC
ncbi:DUF899 domain-containing protein [Ornithinibacillus gellani]|uniref:DUF899 domain-containing protein n=1 Tax=Ornithinibacillus gellani TaxID=2293253 RepID=UPI0021DFB562|nr:DUF899 domain-containing protein [Ornithinibacillus gellani]